MQSNAFPVTILHSPPVAADGSNLHLVLVHRLQLVVFIALAHGTPHAGIMRPQLGGSAEVVQGVEGHAQQLVGLPQPIPGSVVPRAQLYRSPVRLCIASPVCWLESQARLWRVAEGAQGDHRTTAVQGSLKQGSPRQQHVMAGLSKTAARHGTAPQDSSTSWHGSPQGGAPQDSSMAWQGFPRQGSLRQQHDMAGLPKAGLPKAGLPMAGVPKAGLLMGGLLRQQHGRASQEDSMTRRVHTTGVAQAKLGADQWLPRCSSSQHTHAPSGSRHSDSACPASRRAGSTSQPATAGRSYKKVFKTLSKCLV